MQMSIVCRQLPNRQLTELRDRESIIMVAGCRPRALVVIKPRRISIDATKLPSRRDQFVDVRYNAGLPILRCGCHSLRMTPLQIAQLLFFDSFLVFPVDGGLSGSQPCLRRFVSLSGNDLGLVHGVM